MNSAHQGLLNPDALQERITAQLGLRFAGIFSVETIDHYVYESYLMLFHTAAVKTHVHVLTQRFAAERLTALAQSTGAVPKTAREVLFVCTHNAGRSQIAAALMNHLGRGRVHVRTAGSDPASQVDPGVVETLAEIGLDAAEEFPKPLTDEVVRAADVVVTLGCGDACPVFPGRRYLDWQVEDPAGKSPEQVRAIREDIDVRVQALFAELQA